MDMAIERQTTLKIRTLKLYIWFEINAIKNLTIFLSACKYISLVRRYWYLKFNNILFNVDNKSGKISKQTIEIISIDKKKIIIYLYSPFKRPS